MDFFAQAALSNAVVVSLLAPIVLAIDRLSHRPALAHGLWLLLLVKLVTPPLLSIALAWPANTPWPQSAAAPTSPAPQPQISSGSFGDSPATTKTARSSPADPERDRSGVPSRVATLAQTAAFQITLRWGPSLANTWLAISGLGLVWISIKVMRAHHQLGSAPLAPTDVHELALKIAVRLGLKHSPRVCFVPGIMSPALWALGPLSRLLVPQGLWSRLDEDQQSALLAHELSHLRRHDHWIRPLELLIISFYWWLPVVWWIRKSLHEAEEQCCDSWVVWALPGSKRAYARTLLDTIDFLAETRPALPLAASGFGTVATLRTRLREIMKGSRPRRLSATGATSVATAAMMVIPLAWRQELDRGVPRGYRIIDLGRFEPIAINNVGQVIGSPFDLTDQFVRGRMGGPRKRGHRWEQGRWTDLAARDDLFVTPTDMNDQGQITGWYEFFLEPADEVLQPNGLLTISEAKYSVPRAFRTQPNRPINLPADDIGTLAGDESRGLAINNAGQVAGESVLPSTFARGPRLTRVFRTAPQQPINPRTDQLDRFDPREYHPIHGVVMNNQGDVVVNMDFGARRPAYYVPPGQFIDDPSLSLGPDEETGEVRISAINDERQVVASVTSGARGMWAVPVSFRLGPDRPVNTETDRLPPSFVSITINNNGLILGRMAPQNMAPYSIFAIYDGRRLHRLSELIPEDSGWHIWLAADINDWGQIIGMGITSYGDVHGFLLDPAPEPAWFVWLLAGTVLTGIGQSVRIDMRRSLMSMMSWRLGGSAVEGPRF